MMTLMGIEPGTRIDQFEVVQNIGRGAFSEVYLARDAEGKQVVLKCPFDTVMGDTNSFDRFRREMEIARRLDHPGIQRSYDLQAHRSRPYLVLEYIEGETLRDLLRKEGRLTTARSIDFAEQLAGAMAYAHSQGVFHRDLKPENVLVTPEGRVVVTDFGIALLSGARRLTWRYFTSALGTPDYMAPEQIQGKRGDARTDIYAIGIMLYEMLAGQVPWGGDNPLAVMQQHLSAPLPALHLKNPDVLAPLEAVIRKCLRKNPDERYQHAGELLDDLRHWQDLDLTRFVFGDEAELAPASQRGLWLIIAGLSLGFLATSAVAVYLYYLLSHAGQH